MPPSKKKRTSILPGFGLTMGFTLLYTSLIVLIPLAALFFKSASMSWHDIHKELTNPFLLASLKITFGFSFLAAIINVIFGFITAWTLMRYPFPGRRLLDAMIDLPFALPTAVSGITLATLYSRDGWLGGPWTSFSAHANSFLTWTHLSNLLAFLHLPDAFPDQVAYSQLGILVALVFIGVPFVVRTLQPALEDLDPEVEEAAASLGASRAQAFRRVVFPALFPALLTGFSLSFARAIGEYGSVIFISSNKPGVSQITAHLIMQELEGNNYAGATMLGLVMLIISFILLISINGLQWWSSRRYKAGVT